MAEDNRQLVHLPVAKARFMGSQDALVASNVKDKERLDPASQWSNVKTLEPPYNPEYLAALYENSSSLSKNIESYVTNIHGFGHRLEPLIDLQSPDVDEVIRDALRLEKTDVYSFGDVPAEPTDAEVEARKKKLAVEIRLERSRLEVFFESCSVGLPFSGVEGLRGRTGKDQEAIGAGYWEVLRNKRGKPTQFNHIQPYTIRLTPVDDEDTDVEVPVRQSVLKLGKRKSKKRFRRYVQMMGDNAFVYFKEYSDPRIISANTGKVYESVADLKKNEPDAQQATEILEFKIYAINSAYGIPRWVGALLSVLGNREAEEVNFLYFKNKTVPPLAILVSGGRLNAETVKRLENYIENELAGKHNFWKTMILEAEAANGDVTAAGRMKIELKPLTSAQQQDALFQDYDKRNDAKIGQLFRLPPILRGDVENINRATAEAALDFAELQIFGPLRENFDWAINHLLFPEIGVVYHRFISNAPSVRDPKGLAEIIKSFAEVGVITPEEARDIAAGVLNRQLRNIDAPWTKQPIPLTLAGRPLEDDRNTPEDESARNTDFSGQGQAAATASGMQSTGASQEATAAALKSTVAALIKLRERLEKIEGDQVRKAFADSEDAEVIRLPVATMKQFFAETD